MNGLALSPKITDLVIVIQILNTKGGDTFGTVGDDDGFNYLGTKRLNSEERVLG